jgi:hypothetical protein
LLSPCDSLRFGRRPAYTVAAMPDWATIVHAFQGVSRTLSANPLSAHQSRVLYLPGHTDAAHVYVRNRYTQLRCSVAFPPTIPWKWTFGVPLLVAAALVTYWLDEPPPSTMGASVMPVMLGIPRQQATVPAFDDAPAVAETPLEVDDPSLTGSETDRDAALRRKIAGTWEQQRHGHRALTVRSDGTATMSIEPAQLWRLVVGPRLTLEIVWTIQDGRLDFESVSGEPQDKFDVATRMFGRKRSYPIQDVNDEQIMLTDESDGSEEVWFRAPASGQ